MGGREEGGRVGGGGTEGGRVGGGGTEGGRDGGEEGWKGGERGYISDCLLPLYI